MTKNALDKISHPARLPEEAFSRIAEAAPVAGNRVALLRDAAENYPAWLAAIARAERTIHFESYIIHDDRQGDIFADALIAKAAEGVRVRLVYDWMGGFGKTSRSFWRRLHEGGVEVRCYNPFRFDSPLGWINRDHRKVMTVDGRIGFVTGLCIGQMWVGYPEKGLEPWRDTGVEIRGKAVADIDYAFADIWDSIGDETIPEEDLVDEENLPDAGDVRLRVVAGKPGDARIYRLDQLLGSLARETLWLTDAYFAGTSVYIETLCSAALDGVDVRLLVPATTDIPVMQTISRSGYRRLLEDGVRIFEWNGTMLHAKTAVIDGFWSRVGSTNLNLASWLSNCEIDVLIENREFGQQMQQMYRDDLANATEIVLNKKRKALPVRKRRRRIRRKRKLIPGSSGSARLAPSAIAIGSAFGKSLTTRNRRELGATEARIAFLGGILLLALSLAAIFWPALIAIPLGAIGLWFAASLFINSVRMLRSRRQQQQREEIPEKRVLEVRKTEK